MDSRKWDTKPPRSGYGSLVVVAALAVLVLALTIVLCEVSTKLI